MAWQIRPGQNQGYPIHTDNPYFAAVGLTPPYPRMLMQIQTGRNDGYPFFGTLPFTAKQGVCCIRYGTRKPVMLYAGTRPVLAAYYGSIPVFSA